MTARELVPQLIVRGIGAALVFGCAVFISAGDIGWIMGWVVLVFMIGGMTAASLAMARVSPDLLAERLSLKGGVQKGDLVLAYLIAIVIPLAILITAGLDRRFGWGERLPFAARLGGLVLMALGQQLMYRAMLANRFFSSVVRIQTERGHHVVTTGPYRVVRHPGYVGILLYWIGTPLTLGSAWALLPAALDVSVTVLRAALEDRTLHGELTGYAEYAQRVRYRLIPYVW